MLERSKLEQLIVSNIQLQGAEYYELYLSGDPRIKVWISSIADFLVELSKDIDTATFEPFIKATDRTIYADASNKGILPIASPSRQWVEVTNNGSIAVQLSAGRIISDNAGRAWRLVTDSVINGNNQDTPIKILVEQSEVYTTTYVPSETKGFNSVKIDIDDGLYVSDIAVTDSNGNTYIHTPRFMNVASGDFAYNVFVDNNRSIYIEFGETGKAGVTASTNDSYTITTVQTYGYLDVLTLKEASIDDITNALEANLDLKFTTGENSTSGANPISLDYMRLLSSYPALYDENAVYLGNFDFLVRRKYANRCKYISVWNETIQERVFGVNINDINKLHLAFIPTNDSEKTGIATGVKQLIANADSLYDGRVIEHEVVPRSYNLTINGRLASVHDVETVTTMIKTALLSVYGINNVAVSRWLPDGLNMNEVISIINNLPVFKDKISDFSVMPEDLSVNIVKPTEYLYLTDTSITVNLTRTADTGGSRWII